MAKKKEEKEENGAAENAEGGVGTRTGAEQGLTPADAPPKPEVEDSKEAATGLPENEGVAHANLVAPEDDLRTVNRKVDNQAEVNRFLEEHTDSTTKLGNNLRGIPKVGEQIRAGEHGGFVEGNEGPRVKR